MTAPEVPLSRRPAAALPCLLAAAVVLAAAVGVRFAGLTQAPLWFDEIWHAELSTGRGSAHLRLPTDTWLAGVPAYPSLQGAPPAVAIPGHMDGVLHPPLYHLLLRGWRSATAGDSTFGLRAFSATVSAAAVAFVMAAAWRWRGPTVGLIAGAIAAVSAAQVNQAQDARGYTLLLVLTLLAAGVARRFAAGPAGVRPAVALAALCLGMMWTHYFALGACAGLGGYALATAKDRRDRRILAASLAVAAAVWLILWGPTLRAQLAYVEETADIFLLDPAPGHLGRTVLRVLALPLRLVWAAPELPLPLLAAGGAAVWAAILLQARRANDLALWLAILGGTTGLLAGLDLARGTQHLAFARYALLASPAAVLALAGAVALVRPAPLRLAVAAAAVGGLFLALPAGRERNLIDARPLVEHLALRVDAREPIVLVSPNPLGRDAQALYLYLAWYAPELFPRDLYLATRPIEVPADRAAWVVAANPATDPARVWPGAAVESAWRGAAWGSAFKIRPPASTSAPPATLPAARP